MVTQGLKEAISKIASLRTETVYKATTRINLQNKMKSGTELEVVNTEAACEEGVCSYPVRSYQRRGCNIAYDNVVTTNGRKSAEVIVDMGEHIEGPNN